MADGREGGAAIDTSGKAPEAYRTISEAAEAVGVPQHVLRFWETRFPQVRPIKRAGGRRHYRPADLALLRRIRELLHDQGYSIRGVQRLLRTQGVRAVVEGRAGDPPAAPDNAADRPPQGDADAVTSRRSELEGVLRELVQIRDLLG